MSKNPFRYRLFSAAWNLIIVVFIFLFLNHLEGSEISGREIGDPNCIVRPCSSWVKIVSLKEGSDLKLSKEHFDAYLLIDHQIEADQKEEFYHAARHLSSPGSVQENSLIDIEFDPSYESINLHNLGVYRNHSYIDKIDTARMEVIQQEKNISGAIYNGIKSWIIFLEDVQPGDIIEYSFSRVGRPPVLEKYLVTTFPMQKETLISQGHFRLVGSDSSKFQLHGHLTAIKPKHLNLDGGKQEWVWEVSDVPAYEGTSSVPNWYTPIPCIQISSFDDWNEVATWGASLFQLPQNYFEELEQLANTLKAKSPLLEEQIHHAIHFVQDEIRYLGFEFGDNAYRPHKPEVVLKRRSGDCKDKVLLLMALLDLMGVQSCPVLVNSSIQEHIADWLPTSAIFNHAILQIQIEDKRYWVDPTLSYSGGSLRSMVCGPFGKGLLLNKEAFGLTEIPFDAKGSLRKAITTINLSQSDNCKVISETIYTGLWANNYRSRYCNGNGLKVMEKRFKEYYSKLYGALTSSAPFDIKDDLEKNELIINAAYDVKNPWRINDINKTPVVDIYASEIGSLLSLSVDSMQKVPCELVYPGYAIEEIFVVFPKTSIPWDDTPYRFELDNDELRFFTEWKPKDRHSIHFYYELMNKKDHIPVEKIEEWHQESQQISNLISRTISKPEEAQDIPASMPATTLFFIITCLVGILIWLYYMLK